jgi:surfeit locus 1 family protein
VSEQRRFPVFSSLLVLVVFAILIGLGVWQVQRLKWKTDLLHRIALLQTAPPEPIDAVLRRAHARQDINFTRVRLDCQEVETTPVLRLYSVYQGLAGYRLITACPLASGPYASILVDRGFVATPGAEAPRPIPGVRISQPVIGVLRAPEPKALITAANQPAQNLWYWRDLPAMARALHAQGAAPAFLMLERPAPESAEPRPAPLPVNIPNNHLGYAITWFGLAAALVGVYLASLLRKRPT